MVRSVKRIVAVASLVLMTGCATTQFTPDSAAKGTDGVSVLYDYPSAPYRKIGLIDMDYYRPGLRAPTVTDAMPRLRARTREVGGNAFIVRGQRPGQIASRSIIVSVEVLAVDEPRR
jgi:Mrp family chromosome partitioning ATPase